MGVTPNNIVYEYFGLKWILPDKFLRRKDRYDNEKKLNVIFYGVYHGDFMEFGLR